MSQIANLPFNWIIRGPDDGFRKNPKTFVGGIRFWNGSPLPFLGNNPATKFTFTCGGPENNRIANTPTVVNFTFTSGGPENHRIWGKLTVPQFTFSANR